MLFNKWLCQPIKEEHKDTVWATAGTLAILTFSSIHAHFPDQAWPLAPRDASDLEWLRFGTGKMKLCHLVNPSRAESVFRTMTKTFPQRHEELPSKGTYGITSSLVHLCGLDESSTMGNNPYFNVVHSLSRLLEIPNSEVLHSSVMMVSGNMHNEFEVQLEKKDPVALALLCLWYIKARKVRWWIDLRARYEVPAISTYLQQYHIDDSRIRALINWIRKMDIE